jgi:hypothetical protein
MLVMPFAAAAMTRWMSPGIVSGVGLVTAAAGLLWLSRISPTAGGYAAVAPMLLIGFGAAMPWGLMDGLSVSVVPRERAGMATGIFSTTRVAGEGLALAIVGAALATLIQSGLTNVAPDALRSEAAQRLAAGDIGGAATLVPMISRDLLEQSYVGAFATLLDVLAAISVLSAVAAIAFLGSAEADRPERPIEAFAPERDSN